MGIGLFLFFAILIIAAGLLSAALVWTIRSGTKSAAGPHWFWRFGRHDPIRNLFFRQDGSFRSFGRVVLSTILECVLLLVLVVLTASISALFRK
jgi:hypothetical protein